MFYFCLRQRQEHLPTRPTPADFAYDPSMSLQQQTNLLPELWDLILQYVLTDTGMYLPLVRVCKLFKSLIAPHAPQIYIDVNIYPTVVPDNGVVSMKKLKKFFGNWSGLAIAVRKLFTIVGSHNSHNAWLRLKPENHGWFAVQDAFWNTSNGRGREERGSRA